MKWLKLRNITDRFSKPFVSAKSNNDIAVIGISCRFPGAHNYQEYWHNLLNGMNSIKEISVDRWDINKYYSSEINAPNKSVSKWGGLLDQIDRFDNQFFNISPREAKIMDPQQRILLEEVWHCVEDAGISLKVLQQYITAVYVGMMTTDYQRYLIDSQHQIDSYDCLGNYGALLANRISYFLDLKGESKTIDTACSSSLVALHEAQRSLLAKECDYAIAAGVNIICHPWKYISFSKSHMLSLDGQCKTFDAKANGYVPGEGVAALLLQPLEKAVAMNHHIYGVLKGSSVKHNGRSKSITAPSIETQKDLIAEVLKTNSIAPESISYIEAHGTGTSLGDPIEVAALSQAFDTQSRQYCHIGSVKSNIGHLEAASGLAGVIKVLLMMQHQFIPKTLNIESINPIIDFDSTPFCVAKEATVWNLPENISVRRAGVSSFGFGGVIAHAILEEYIPRGEKKGYEVENDYIPFLLSAKSSTSLSSLLKQWQSYSKTENSQKQSLTDICYTLMQGRENFDYRFGVLVTNKKELTSSLETANNNLKLINASQSLADKSIILYLGSIIDCTYDDFRKVCSKMSLLSELEDNCLKELCNIPGCKKILFNLGKNKAHLQQLEHFLILYIISRALLISGLKPYALISDTIGQLVNIVLSGMLSFTQAVKLIIGIATEYQIKRPSLNVHDLSLNAMIEPFRITETYCQMLRDSIDIDLETTKITLEKSAQLMINQFTFKKYLEEWQSVFNKRGLILERVILEFTTYAKNQQLLLLIALLVAHEKLNQKWNLKKKLLRNVYTTELIDLLIDKAVTPEHVAQLLLENNYQLIANYIQNHQNLIDKTKPYFLLRQQNVTIQEISDIELWIQNILNNTNSLVTSSFEQIKNSCYLSIGQSANFQIPSEITLSLHDLDKTLPSFLLNLWEIGIPVDWQQWYRSSNWKRLTLPAYPFLDERHWYNQSFCETTNLQKEIIKMPGHHKTKLTPTAIKKLSIEQNDCSLVKLEIANNIAQIRLEDKANKNQLTESLLHGLTVRFEEIATNSQVKAIVITGYDDVFCLGGSHEVLEKIVTKKTDFTAIQSVYKLLLDCPIPVISAIQGHAFGGGLVLGLYADIIVMSEDHLFSANFMQYGFTPGLGATLILKEKLSERIATEMIWTAQEFTGKSLKEKGANILFEPKNKVLQRALAIAQTLTEKSPNALKVYKRSLTQSIVENLSNAIEQELKMHEEIFSNQEAFDKVQSHFTRLETFNDTTLTTFEVDNQKIPDVCAEKASNPSIPVHSKETIVNKISEIVARILHLSPQQLAVKEKFISLGVDSIAGIEIIHTINNFFTLTIQAAKLYDYPTIIELADFVYEQTKDQISPVEITTSKFTSQIEIPTIEKKSLKLRDILSPELPQKDNQIQNETNVFDTANNDIAIIGMSGRFPGANDIETFWDNLVAGKESITEVSSERWSTIDFYAKEKNLANKSYSKWGGFLAEIAMFDPTFFNLSPLEAKAMDPQQRFFLEESWRAFEDAGYSRKSLKGKNCGVFVGVFPGDYQTSMLTKGSGLDAHSFIGNSCSILAGRIAFLLDLTGPTIAIDTACSSSLVALHKACQSLAIGESEIALVGGVNIMTTPNMHIMTSQAGMLSANGQGKAFDNNADGFVPGEAVGIIILKPLNKALADGNSIYAVIKGYGINQDGSTNGITAPSGRAQENLVQEVYRKFNIDPAYISYVEAHGTGTKLGDPIEVGALNNIFKQHTDKKHYCALGSVKNNIGHTLAAAGIVGVIKTALCLKHKYLVPTINYQTPNEHIEFQTSPFYVNTEYKDWNRIENQQRLAAISSFGFSGTNAHVVLAEAPENNVIIEQRKPFYLVTLSARNVNSLKEQVINLQNYLNKYKNLSLESIAYTLNVGRSHFEYRCAMVVSSIDELKDILDKVKADKESSSFFINKEESLITNNTPFIYNEILSKFLEDFTLAPSDTNLYRQKLLALADQYIKGYEINWEILHSDETKQFIHLPTYPFSRKSYWFEEEKNFLNPTAQSEPTVTTFASPPDKQKEDLTEEIKLILKKVLRELLYLDEDVNTEKVFNDYGLDSILAVNFTSQINTHFGVKITTAKLYNFPTISKLSNYLVDIIAKQNNSSEENKEFSKSEIQHIKPPELPTETISPIKVITNSKLQDEPKRFSNNKIAIIGVAAYLPGAHTKEELWQNLQKGFSAINEIPSDRWSIAQYYSPDETELNKSCSKWGGFIENISCFDPLFFEISPAEAKWMDPQQRLFLEVCWQALEDAGYSHRLEGSRCGIYAGVMNNDYQELLQNIPDVPPAQRLVGNSNAILAARMAYFLNLKGPAVTIDTACSSSLVALHMACRTLQQKEADLMLAGGVTLYLTEKPYIAMSKAQMLSKDGICRTFDNKADGFVPGEGCVTLVLKRLDDAIKDNDHIYGVISGSGFNQDGRTNGITAPSAESQKNLLLSIYQENNIDPSNITYVEAHGTGTKLGDPIEVEALTDAFKNFTNKQHYCALGSIKTNVGHTSAAAGVASVLKVLLCMQHKQLVPSINFDQANEHIDFINSPFYVNTTLKNWDRIENKSLLAAVSSFGFSGTNVHVVIEEAPEPKSIMHNQQFKSYYLITFSAAHPESLKKQISNLQNYLQTNPKCSLEAIAYTLNTKRKHFEYRCAMVVGSLEELKNTLQLVQQDSYPEHYFTQTEKAKKIHEPGVNEILAKIFAEIKEYKSLTTNAYQNKLFILADLYSKGYMLDWKILHQDEEHQFLSLPTYPFLEREYWLQDVAKEKERISTAQKRHAVKLAHIFQREPYKDNSIKDSKITLKLKHNVSVENNSKAEPIQKDKSNNNLSLNQITQELKNIFTHSLYLEDVVEDDKTLSSYGIDSILGVELIKKINTHFGLKLTAANLYDFPTIKDLTMGVLTALEQSASDVKHEKDNDSNDSHSLENLDYQIEIISEDKLQEKNSNQNNSCEDIAIIGMAAYLPQAKDIKTLWQHLQRGHSAISEIPSNRWSIEQHYNSDINQTTKSYSKWGGFIENIDCFDPLFFGISPAEAEWMDPQQRLFLEVSWHALEDSGYTVLNGTRCGVYAGVMSNDYQELANRMQTVPIGHRMLGNSNSILAARVAYFLNLKGPAITIDTACSSSLVAMHLACQSLQRQETDLMLVGGVTLYLTETPYIEMCKAGMLSKEAFCKPFDNRADGFVPGEGCAIVVLKRLSDAIKAGDRIYGIVRGSGINQDGKTNGITAPSSESQKALELSIYEKYAIDPANITYVEAHGTGTKLGDPIEVEALTKAFRNFTDKQQYCALGSIKGNLGHTSAAAGITSLIKVLLCMKYKRIVPSINFESPNEHIDFINSPFYVNTTLKVWEQVDKKPLQAAISSFGFSGTNAHLVIEEGPSYITSYKQNKPYYLLTLSAKHPESLKKQISNLVEYLATKPDISLEAIAYTLNTGRGHFNYRCALVVSSNKELQEALENILLNKNESYYFISKEAIKPDHSQIAYEILEKITAEINNFKVLDSKIYAKKLLVLAELYTQGHNLDWNALHEGEKKQRISLPGYSFLQNHYWLPTVVSEENLDSNRNDLNTQIPVFPLIGLNKSTTEEHSFETMLKVDDFYLKDHQILGKNILPAVCYLEMVKKAAELTLPISKFIHFSQVALITPLIVNAKEQIVEIYFYLRNDNYEFEIITKPEEVSLIKTIHVKGKFHIISQSISNPAFQTIDILAIQNRCMNIQDHETIYHLFESACFHYGPSFKGIKQIWRSNTELLAEIKLPSDLSQQNQQWEFHPSLLDSALQAAIGLYGDEFAQNPFIPFAIKEINFHNAINPGMTFYSYIKLIADNCFQAIVLDAAGSICIEFCDVMIRPAKEYLPIYYLPKWREDPILSTYSPPLSKGKNVLLVGVNECGMLQESLTKLHHGDNVIQISLKEGDATWQQTMSQLKKIDSIYYIQGSLNEGEKHSEQSVLTLFYFLKEIINKYSLQQSLILKAIVIHASAIHSNECVSPSVASLKGLICTFAREYPYFMVSFISLSNDALLDDRQLFAEAIINEPPHKRALGVSLQKNAKRYTQTLEPLLIPKNDLTPFRKKGTYLIIGGASGIGFVLSQHLASHYQAQLVWVGRRSEETHRDKIANIKSLGAKIIYCQADITDFYAMQLAINQAKAKFGNLHGVIHSALELKDKTLVNMDETTFKQVLAAKTTGSILLHRLLKNEPLDFLLFFSSAQSYFCNAGQSNYATGCIFQDALVQSLQKNSSYPVKEINWGYWGNVGIVATAEHRKRMMEQGILSIEAEEGIKAIYDVLNNPIHQLIVLKAKEPILKELGVNTKYYSQIAEEYIPSGIAGIVNEFRVDQINFNRDYYIAFKELDHWGHYLLLTILQQMGIFQEIKQYQRDNLVQQLKIVPSYHKLFNLLIDILIKAQLIHQENNKLILNSVLDPEFVPLTLDLLEQKKLFLTQNFPDIKVHIELLWNCVLSYPDILTGRQSYREVIFPKGAVTLIEGIYQNNQLADYYNQQIVQSVLMFVKNRLQQDPTATISILEIGAGTGGTSASVLNNLEKINARIRYVYTDVSLKFVNFGKDKWEKGFPWVEFKCFDVEKSPETQGFIRQSVDLIIASNVLHATRNMEITVENVKYLLKGQGILILNELTQRTDFASMTFGTTEGWWLFEDEENRIPLSPLLSVSQWQHLLTQNGFKQVRTLSEEKIQNVILAESNGMISLAKTINIIPSKPLPASHTVQIPLDTNNVRPKDNVDEISRDKVNHLIKSIFSKVLKIDTASILNDATFENYGVDSLVVLELNKQFAEIFPQISATLLFEYTTINKLADYFIQCHQATLNKYLMINVTDNVTAKSLATFHSQTSEQVDSIPENEDIAIIGLAGRYPKANNIEEFWDLLKNGKSGISEIPCDRWDWRKHFDPDKHIAGKHYSKWGGFIDQVDQFDPLFFHITPDDASTMDPQERLFLEIAWCTFEDAGYNHHNFAQFDNQVGVFIGVMNNDYNLISAEAYHKQMFTSANSSHWSIANRVSYYFDLQGPSMSVDTACSSSLTAVHLACESLKRGECSIALAGAVNLVLHPLHYSRLCSVNMLAQDNKCKPFDVRADGFVDGEGIGAILLKPLSKAIADNDNIYAVIKGSSINSGGKTSGFTVPNPNAQAELIIKAIEKSKINPRTISYLEAHGTGTSLGDPIEISGLTKAYRKFTSDKQFCAIGSVKSNIGHLESAAGIAAITKVLLQFKYKKLVPSLHVETLSDKINFIDSPFVVQNKLEDWQQPLSNMHGKEYTYSRRAGISSFGAGGANAHIILEEYVAAKTETEENIVSSNLIVLSAKNNESLKKYACSLLQFLETIQINSDIRIKKELSLTNIAYTLQVGRESMNMRLAIIAQTIEEAKEKLTAFINQQIHVENIFFNQVKENNKENKFFLEEGNDNKFITRIIQNKNLQKIAISWINGITIDWSLLYKPNELPLRISLPTYPFFKRKCAIMHAESTENKNNNNESPDESKQRIINNIASVLAINNLKIDTNLSFKEIGLDNIEIMKLIKYIKKSYAHAEPLIIFDCKNIDELISYLVKLENEFKTLNESNNTTNNTFDTGENDLKIIVQIVADILKTNEEEINVKTDISEYGLDSINIMFLHAKINEIYGKKIDPKTIISCRTIKELANVVANYDKYAESA